MKRPPQQASGTSRPNAGFLHEKLDAYRVALEMARAAKALAQQIPRGHRNVADHLLRSASNAVLLLAEVAEDDAAVVKEHAARVGAMLTRLIQKLG